MFSMLDDTLWSQFLAKLQVQIQEGKIRGVVMMHHGTTFNTSLRNDSPIR